MNLRQIPQLVKMSSHLQIPQDKGKIKKSVFLVTGVLLVARRMAFILEIKISFRDLQSKS